MTSKFLLVGMSLFSLIPAIGYIKKAFETKEPLVDRKIILEILRTMKKEYYTIFRQIAFMSEKIRSDTKFTDEQVTSLIMGEGKPSNIILNMVSERILQRFHVTKQAFDHSCEVYKQDDIELGLMLSELELEMSLALKGTLKEYRGEFPMNFTPNKVMEIYTKLIRIQMKEQVKIYKNTIMNGSRRSQAGDSLNKTDEVDKLLEEYGLDQYDEHGLKILQSAVENFYNKDPDFRNRLLSNKKKFQNLIKSIEDCKVTVKAEGKTDLSFLDKLRAEIQNVQMD